MLNTEKVAQEYSMLEAQVGGSGLWLLESNRG